MVNIYNRGVFSSFIESRDNMVLFQTTMQKELAKLPTELDFQRITVQREITTSKDVLDTLRRLESGTSGEDLFVQKLEEFGKPDWTIIRNLRLKDYSTFEVDVVLITRNCVYIFEVKNYTGHFEFNQGDSYFNGMELNSNIVQQTRNALVNMRNICGKFFREITVQGALVFIGENNQVSIQSDTGDVQILKLTDLYAFIKNIIAEEHSFTFPQFHSEKLIAHLETFETENNYLPVPLTDEEVARARSGIYCARCLSYAVEITKNYVICSCGLHEPREEAMIRTICEYGVLTHNRDFSTGKILKLIGNGTSEIFTRNILNKYFPRKLNGRYTNYKNMKLPYHKIQHLFEITSPQLYYTDRGNRKIYILE